MPNHPEYPNIPLKELLCLYDLDQTYDLLIVTKVNADFYPQYSDDNAFRFISIYWGREERILIDYFTPNTSPFADQLSDILFDWYRPITGTDRCPLTIQRPNLDSFLANLTAIIDWDNSIAMTFTIPAGSGSGYIFMYFDETLSGFSIPRLEYATKTLNKRFIPYQQKSESYEIKVSFNTEQCPVLGTVFVSGDDADQIENSVHEMWLYSNLSSLLNDWDTIRMVGSNRVDKDKILDSVTIVTTETVTGNSGSNHYYKSNYSLNVNYSTPIIGEWTHTDKPSWYEFCYLFKANNLAGKEIQRNNRLTNEILYFPNGSFAFDISGYYYANIHGAWSIDHTDPKSMGIEVWASYIQYLDYHPGIAAWADPIVYHRYFREYLVAPLAGYSPLQLQQSFDSLPNPNLDPANNPIGSYLGESQSASYRETKLMLPAIPYWYKSISGQKVYKAFSFVKGLNPKEGWALVVGRYEMNISTTGVVTNYEEIAQVDMGVESYYFPKDDGTVVDYFNDEGVNDDQESITFYMALKPTETINQTNQLSSTITVAPPENIVDCYAEITLINWEQYLQTKDLTNMVDSQRIKEIHACLSADEFAWMPGTTDVHRISTLGRQLHRLARIWGISENPDGTIRSIRRKAIIPNDGSTEIPAGWYFGQFGVNHGGSTEGQQGGNPDEERDGIVYENRSNTFMGDSETDGANDFSDLTSRDDFKITKGSYVLCENIPQYIDAMLDDLDKGLNWQESGAGFIPNSSDPSSPCYYEGLGTLVAEAVGMLSQLSGNIRRSEIVTKQSFAMLQELIAIQGASVEVKNLSLDIGLDDTALVPIMGFSAQATTVAAHFSTVLENLAPILTTHLRLSAEAERSIREANAAPDPAPEPDPNNP